MLLSSSHCTRSDLSDHNQLRVLYCSWKGRIAPFPGVHHSILPDMKPHVPSSSAVVPFHTNHRSNCLLFSLPQKFRVANRFYPLTSSFRWFVSLLSCKGPSITLCRSPLMTSPHSENDPALCLLPCFYPGENFLVCPVTT